MKEEISSGIKNAIERGSSLEKAVQSFINAGYNPDEVNQAAAMVSQSTSEIIVQSNPLKSNIPNSNPTPVPAQNTENSKTIVIPSTIPLDKPKHHNRLIIILLVVLFLLASGIISLIMFKDTILNALLK